MHNPFAQPVNIEKPKLLNVKKMKSTKFRKDRNNRNEIARMSRKRNR